MTALTNATAPRKKTAKPSMLVLDDTIQPWYFPNKKPAEPASKEKAIMDKDVAAFEAYHKLTEALVADKGWVINREHIEERYKAVHWLYRHSASCAYLLDGLPVNITLELKLTEKLLKPQELSVSYLRNRNNQNTFTIPIKSLTQESCEQVMARVHEACARLLASISARKAGELQKVVTHILYNSSVDTNIKHEQLLFKPENFDVEHIKSVFLDDGVSVVSDVVVIGFCADMEHTVVYASYKMDGIEGVYGFEQKEYLRWLDDEVEPI